jgi:hypothetical protein
MYLLPALLRCLPADKTFTYQVPSCSCTGRADTLRHDMRLSRADENPAEAPADMRWLSGPVIHGSLDGSPLTTALDGLHVWDEQSERSQLTAEMHTRLVSHLEERLAAATLIGARERTRR